MFVTIITDCADENARGRQVVRAVALLAAPAAVVGVRSDLEAAGNLLDALDAGLGGRGAVFVNIAPRAGSAKRWGNGSPFSFFFWRETLVLATVEGLSLSLAKKVALLSGAVRVLSTGDALDALRARGDLSGEEASRIAETQFRSYEFLPRAARAILAGASFPAQTIPLADIPDPPQAVWWVDNFGNCKTTLFADESVAERRALATKFGPIPFFAHLKDVPDGEAAAVAGSSGFGGRRFLEIVVQGGSAADRFGIRSGDAVA